MNTAFYFTATQHTVVREAHHFCMDDKVVAIRLGGVWRAYALTNILDDGTVVVGECIVGVKR